MNEDIERALNGSDADLRAFVASLRAAPQARVRDGFAADVIAAVEAEARRGAFARSLRGLLRPAALFPLAACLVALLAVASIFFRPVPKFSLEKLVACQRADGSFSSSTAAPYVQAYAVTVLAKGTWRHSLRPRRPEWTLPCAPIAAACATCACTASARCPRQTSRATRVRLRPVSLRPILVSRAASPSPLASD